MCKVLYFHGRCVPGEARPLRTERPLEAVAGTAYRAGQGPDGHLASFNENKSTFTYRASTAYVLAEAVESGALLGVMLRGLRFRKHFLIPLFDDSLQVEVCFLRLLGFLERSHILHELQ